MQYFVTTHPAATEKTDCIVIALFEQGLLSPSASALNESTHGRIQAIIDRGDITGKVGQTLLLQDVEGVTSPRKATQNQLTSLSSDSLFMQKTMKRP